MEAGKLSCHMKTQTKTFSLAYLGLESVQTKLSGAGLTFHICMQYRYRVKSALCTLMPPTSNYIELLTKGNKTEGELIQMPRLNYYIAVRFLGENNNAW